MTTNTSTTGNIAVTNLQALATSAAVTPPTTVAAVGKARVAFGPVAQANPAQLLVTSQHILTGMTGNAAYPAPLPTLAELTAARNAFSAAVDAARDSRLQIVVRNRQRVAFVALLRTLALYVQATSGGDLATLLSSGFTAQRRKQPVGPLPAPANLRLVRGRNSGQIIARCNTMRQAGAYGWRYASAATPATWVGVASTYAASTIIEGLIPGTQYTVQAQALGTAGPSDWSDAAALMVV
jgi:hypothetical protein